MNQEIRFCIKIYNELNEDQIKKILEKISEYFLKNGIKPTSMELKKGSIEIIYSLDLLNYIPELYPIIGLLSAAAVFILKKFAEGFIKDIYESLKEKKTKKQESIMNSALPKPGTDEYLDFSYTLKKIFLALPDKKDFAIKAGQVIAPEHVKIIKEVAGQNIKLNISLLISEDNRTFYFSSEIDNIEKFTIKNLIYTEEKIQ